MIVGSGIGMGHIMMYSADWVFLNLTLKHMDFIQLHFAIVFEKQLVLKSQSNPHFWFHLTQRRIVLYHLPYPTIHACSLLK